MDGIEYGKLNLFQLYSGIIVILLNLGISRSFAFLYWDVYKDEAKLKKLISSTISLILIVQSIMITTGLYFGKSILSFISDSENEFTYDPYLILAFIFSSFMVYFEMFQFFFRNRENLKLYSIMTVGVLLLFTAGNIIGVVVLEKKSIGAIYGRTISYGIISISFLAYFIKKYGISFNLKEYKNIIFFGFPLFINTLIGAIAYGLDKFLIEQFDGLESLGIYSFAIVAITLLEIFFNSLNNSFIPTIFKYLKESFEEKKKEIESIVYLILLALMTVAVVILAAFYPLVDLFIPEIYHKSGQFVPLLICAFFWRAFTGIKSYSLFKEKKTKYFLLNQSSILISLGILGYIGYYYYEMYGLIVGVYFSKLIEFLIMNSISNKVIRLPIYLNNLYLATIILSIISLVISLPNFLSIHRYIAYLLPLISFGILSISLLRKEFIKIIHLIKNRKVIFDS